MGLTVCGSGPPPVSREIAERISVAQEGSCGWIVNVSATEALIAAILEEEEAEEEEEEEEDEKGGRRGRRE